jgi:hypothetical protein
VRSQAHAYFDTTKSGKIILDMQEAEAAEQAPAVQEEADIPASFPQEQEESAEEAEKEIPESLPANLVEESTER